MSLEIVVATTDPRLTAVATVKEELGLPSSATSADARLDRLVLRASAWAEQYVGYPLSAQKYRETLAGYGTRRLMLARTPVRAVPALYFGTATDDGAQLIATTEFGVEEKPGFLTRPQGWDWSVPAIQDITIRPQPGQEYEPWLADYVAGYTLDGLSTDHALWSTVHGATSTARTLPYDIEAAVLAKVCGWYRNREDITGAGTVVAKSVGDLRIQYATGGGSSGSSASGGAAGDPAAALLAPYRRYM